MNNDKSKQVTTWHIDETYLESIWGRIDIYNKGLERSTNLKYNQKLPYIKECWTLLKNVYNDFSPFIKDFHDEYQKLRNLKLFLWSEIPFDQERYSKWIIRFNEVLDELDERKRLIIKSLNDQNSLLTHTMKYSEMDKIKRVMNDD